MRKFLWTGAAVVVAWIIWAAQMPLFQLFGFCYDVTKLGPWGDTFGALNSLFTAGAFLGAVYAILLQQNQIKQDRIDREKVNREARNEEHKQRFETSFLNC